MSEALSLIEKLQEAINRVGPAPSREFRIHPADFAELKARCQSPDALGLVAPSWVCLEIVVDPDAPRLPRA